MSMEKGKNKSNYTNPITLNPSKVQISFSIQQSELFRYLNETLWIYTTVDKYYWEFVYQ